MSRHHGERNPEVRKPEVELPLFAEQNFYKFEQQHSALPEIPAVASFVPPVANEGGEHTGLSARRQLRESHGEQNNQAIAHGVEPSQLREEVPMRDEPMVASQESEKRPDQTQNSGARNLNRNNAENRKTRRRGGEIRRSSADESCLTAPLSANGESGDCRSLSDAQSLSSSPRDVARARRSDPGTSFQAAASVTNLGRVRDGILEILREHGPQIDEDLIVIYHNREKTRGYKLATDQSIRSRRKELERDFGKLVCCGAKKNKRKRMSQIWRLV